MTGTGIRNVFVLVAGLALATAPACRNTAEGVKQDATQNTQTAREGAQAAQDESASTVQKIGTEAKETGTTVGQEAKQVGKTIGQEAKQIGTTVADGAKQVGKAVADGAKQVGSAVKEGAQDVASDAVAKEHTANITVALKAARDIDASHINVDTDAVAKTVTLKGSVPTARQKAAAEKLTREKSAGYTVRNMLIVGSR